MRNYFSSSFISCTRQSTAVNISHTETEWGMVMLRVVYVELICYALPSSSFKQWFQNWIWNYRITIKVSFLGYTGIMDTHQEHIQQGGLRSYTINYFSCQLTASLAQPNSPGLYVAAQTPLVEERGQQTLSLFEQQWWLKAFTQFWP